MEVGKPRMLIAEDSGVAGQLAALFEPHFEVTVARTGQDAFAAVNAAGVFDICLVDVIMPVERDDLPLSGASETGLRLIEHLVGAKKCQRFVVLTVRWDIEDQIKELTEGAFYSTLLLKQSATQESIRNAVAEAMARSFPEGW